MVAVFLKDLRIILRDRWALLFFILVPIVVISIIASALFDSDEGPKLMVPVVNEDQGPVATAFVKLLGKHADVVVCDGFVGNVVLKTLEGGMKALVKAILADAQKRQGDQADTGKAKSKKRKEVA